MNEITALLPHIKLRFNVDNPSYEDSYAFGYECAMAEIVEEENPFQDGTQQSEHWIEGWWDAMAGEQPLFALSLLDNEEMAVDRDVIAANDQQYCHKHSFLSLVIEISGAIAASALVGYQLFELVA